MDAKTLVIGMTITLVFLFIFADRYRKREVELMQLEGQYYEVIREWQKLRTEEAKAKVYEVGKQYGMRLNMLNDDIDKMLERDLNITLSN